MGNYYVNVCIDHKYLWPTIQLLGADSEAIWRDTSLKICTDMHIIIMGNYCTAKSIK